MDVFALRDRVVDDYKRYIESFVRIRDKRIDGFVRQQFESGALWPDPILQLNPAYEPGPTLDELASRSVIQTGTARFFRKPDGGPIRLYKHQHEAIEIARRWEPYVLTTGTGSGKSLTYLVPIYDHILRTNPEKHQVRAIIVYPMNALINSQLKALEDYEKNAGGSPVRFARYTGQEKPERRQQILDDPPHILLTNYVMLEYMLLRPAERLFTDRATANLEFLVLDELHTYRGRQGADVAMLLRRVRERAGNPRILHIGTSATMITEGKREERRRAAAVVASKLFGATVKPENVVDETLQRAIQVPVPEDGPALRAAVDAPVPADLTGFTRYPLAAWTEHTFGLAEEDGRLVRRPPRTFKEGVKRLSEASGLGKEVCAQKLQEALTKGNALVNESGEPLFAFRFHQFLAAGGTVYATLEPSADRQLSLEGQYYAPGEDKDRLLFPLVFCRECGQEYYMVSLRETVDSEVVPRTPLFYAEDDAKTIPGYVALNEGGLWSDERQDDLPDHWRDANDRIKRDFKPHIPRRLIVKANGGMAGRGETGGTEAWFQPSPFLLCLRCGIAYDRREKNDFRKLTRLSHTGRSTATTLISGSTIIQLRRDVSVSDEARKLLSFTDNRQDASLQAGHFNDFIQVALVRAALYKALQERGSLDHATVTQAVFRTLALHQEVYAKEPSEVEPGKGRNETAMLRLLEYRLYEDLRRGWRIVQPNLEQCGLLRVEYPGLPELCQNEDVWAIHPVLKQAPPEVRERAIHAFLDHLRREMAIDARVLDPQEEWELRQRVQQNLREPWAFDQDDYLRQSTMFTLNGGGKGYDPRARSLTARSKPAQFLRSRETWGLQVDLGPNDWQPFLDALVRILQGNLLSRTQTHTRQPAIQLLAGAMRWTLGDGTPPPLDPIRTRRAQSDEFEEVEREANRFFADLYRETARHLAGVEGHAHTGQIPAELREQREERFRNGQLSALFCSPTMELGIDIRDLNVVHMRNIPPAPANYAQRSGRAGRSGQPALVAAFCSEGSPHDQYFFRNPEAMVAGAVAPPRLDLSNEELLRAHIQSVWLAATGINLGRSMTDVLDMAASGYPLLPDILHRTEVSEARTTELHLECGRILDACVDELKGVFWFVPGWLDVVLQQAKSRFDGAFERWRELYTCALQQAQEAARIIYSHSASREERQAAEQREREARREIDLLLNRTQQETESDFYPYRYLAAEGFIPGYNFPRLPLRALLPAAEQPHVVDRPRFLGLGEFGPRNILYHEGRKYRMARCVLPTGGVEGRLKKAKFCRMCGYYHDEPHTGVDICDYCRTPLTGETSEFSPLLFEMPMVKGIRVERITCDEEERTREGYDLELHYRLASGTDGIAIHEKAVAATAGGQQLLILTYGPQASLWRVNRGWRRSDQKGFSMDGRTGFWVRRAGDDDREGDIDEARVIRGVLPFVRDTRNVLLVRPSLDSVAKEDTDAFLASLSYALQRASQLLFQVEEQELSVSRIGEHSERRILFWEAAEGGSGVWSRLMEDQAAVSQVAEEALRLCHFDFETGNDLADKEKCSRACYRCLLSYANQPDHRLLNRFLIRDFLLQLRQAVTSRQAASRSYEEHYQWLKERIDPNSNLEAQFLETLFASRRRLPDRTQFRPEPDVYVEADFYYERDGLKGIVVFVDGPHHDEGAQQEADQRERKKLEDLGYRVVVIRYDRTIADQVAENADVFGPGLSQA
jgi:very-short-patch-repair endonuclease